MLKAKRAAAMMVWLTGAGGAALPAVPCGATSVEETAKLTASDGPDGHQFGISVSVAGDTAVVGANGDDDAGTASGSAYTFRYNGAAWVEEAKLTASDAAAGDGFGISVSVAGDTAVVGARFDDDAGIASGSAYVFRYNGAAWVEEAKLTASDAAAGDGFGASVAVADDIVVVGAGSNTDAGTRSGSAYVFRYNGAAWVEEAKLTASDAAAEDLFGVSVAVADKTAVVGAFGNDDNGSLSGSAYIFRYNGAAWVEEAKLTASDAAAGDHFGISVAVAALNVLTGAGETAVVGAFGDDDSGSVSGSAYIFRYNGAAWVEEAKLTASDAAAEDQFGVSVAVADETAVVGADLDDDNGSFSGSAYIFRYNGAAWVEEAKLTASDAAAGDQFGVSVAVSGDTTLVGAFLAEDNGRGVGLRVRPRSRDAGAAACRNGDPGRPREAHPPAPEVTPPPLVNRVSPIVDVMTVAGSISSH